MAIKPLQFIIGKKYTAVDFGHHSLKVVQCKERKGSIKVIKRSIKILSRGAIINGKIEDISLVSHNIKEMFDEANIKPKNIIFSPASGQEFVRKVEIPVMPEEELEEALRWEVQQFLNLPPERVSSDHIILNQTDENIEVLLAVMPHHILEDYVEVFSKNSLQVKVANVQELALISLLKYQDSLENSSVIINVGANKTRILISSKDKFHLSRSIEVSGNSFTKLFKDDEKSWEEAEEEKKRIELNPELEKPSLEPDFEMMVNGIESTDDVQNRMMALADDLIKEIGRSLDYYRDRNPEDELSTIYLTGGGTRLGGLKKYLRENLDFEIINIDPYINFKNSQKINPADNPVMAVASGLIASEVIHNES